MSEFGQVIFPRKLLKRFIQTYKDNPCLWDRDSPEYKMKSKKHAALDTLTELVQQYDDNATRVHILRKIESMRACVRREYKKVMRSRAIAVNEEDVHQPNLWYYDLLVFLFENNQAVDQSTQSAHEKSEEEVEEEEEEEEEEYPEETHTYEIKSYTPEFNVPIVGDIHSRPSSSRQRNDDGEPYSRRSKTSTEVCDEYDAIGINVAAKLRSLPQNMRILSEKLINDVLFQAQVNGLNSATKLVTPDPFKTE